MSPAGAGRVEPVVPAPMEAVVLTGRHVRLEPLGPEHLDGLVAAAAENRTSYTFTSVPHGLDEMRAAIDGAIAYHSAGLGLGFATIWSGEARSSGGRPVGSTRFLDPQRWPHGPYPSEHLDSIEIGSTWLAASAQRTVVNTEAKLLMLRHAFDVLGVHRVVLNTDVRNERSRDAIERIGARFEGVLHGFRFGVEGTPRDTATFAIVARDWPDVRAKLEARVNASA